jgi:hypothetical protein
MLHNERVNVKAYGAVGDNTTDDTTAIQAAIDSVNYAGTIFFPKGNYKITAPLQLGRTASGFQQNIAGGGWMGGGNAGFGPSRIRQHTLNADIFDISADGTQANGIIIDGLVLDYNGTGTGSSTGIRYTPTSWTTGLLVRNCMIQGAKIGAYIDHVVSPIFEHTTFIGCGTGCQLNGEINLPTFYDVWFQACTTEGLLVTALTYDLRMESCIVEATQSGPGIRVGTASVGGCIFGANFDTTWWEFPTGGPMIQVDNQSSAASGRRWKFTSCHFDGSNLGTGRDVIYINAALASNCTVADTVFETCFFVSLGGSKITRTLNTIQTGSSDPGFHGLTFINCTGNGDIGSVHVPLTGGAPVVFIGSNGPRPSNLLASYGGYMPAYWDFGIGATIVTRPITLPQITANKDDWNLADGNGVSALSENNQIVRLQSDAARNITGILAFGDGYSVILQNFGAFNIVLKHDVTSTAANRFYCPGSVDYTLTPNSMVTIIYDGTSSRWRVK